MSVNKLHFRCRQDRKNFVLATKVRCNMDATKVNRQGLSRRHIVESCEESLERLQTNYIDLYQVRIVVRMYSYI